MTNIGLISENDNSTVLAEYKGLNRVATSYQSEDALEKELIKTLVEQGYERLNINSENELILNLRKQLEKLNNYHFTDREWDDFFTKIIANKNDYIIEKTRLGLRPGTARAGPGTLDRRREFHEPFCYFHQP